MASDLEKYFLDPLSQGGRALHPEVSKPQLALTAAEGGWGDRAFRMTWWPITEPFEMIKDHHAHDFDQFILFVGGDITNMMELGGEVELWLSEDGRNPERFTFTKATFVWIPAGLHHCPLRFTRIEDPLKPILFHDAFFASEYSRRRPGQ